MYFFLLIYDWNYIQFDEELPLLDWLKKSNIKNLKNSKIVDTTFK